MNRKTRLTQMSNQQRKTKIRQTGYNLVGNTEIKITPFINNDGKEIPQ